MMPDDTYQTELLRRIAELEQRAANADDELASCHLEKADLRARASSWTRRRVMTHDRCQTCMHYERRRARGQRGDGMCTMSQHRRTSGWVAACGGYRQREICE